MSHIHPQPVDAFMGRIDTYPRFPRPRKEPPKVRAWVLDAVKGSVPATRMPEGVPTDPE